ncbi:MAG TPA: cytidine/deoxycytidylate deaminase family protein [Armatimonadota bacterium]|nr:cytidine/deoxycytidylate deaminase family protein [Armatimonadota bacterium]
MNHRPNWDEYFLEIAQVVAKRSTCVRRQIGAVIVKDRRILTTGYNGAPSGLAHCLETGCLRDQLGIASGQRAEMCRALHSEMNAIIQAAQHGVSTKGATLYCTHQPCSVCARMLINAGIVRLVYVGDYPDEFAMSLLQESGMEVVRMPAVASTSEVCVP